MKDELDEGDFDRDGYYHWKKDVGIIFDNFLTIFIAYIFLCSLKKDQIGDAWLDGIDWANINSFKRNKDNNNKVDDNKPQKMDDGEVKDDDEDDSASENDSQDDDLTKEDEKDQTEMLKKIIVYLKPGETILKAIKRLGQSSSSSGTKTSTVGLSASQRWLKKKNQDTNNGQQASSSSSLSVEEMNALKESLDKLTGLANYFIDRGFYDIYDETYEKIQRKLENLSKPDESNQDKKLFDIFADDIDETELNKPKASTSDQKQDLQGKQTILFKLILVCL